MSFDLDKLELLKEIETTYDLGFKNLPADLYHFEVGAASKVARNTTNEPRLQIANVVLAAKSGDENDGKTHTEFLSLWGRQDVEAATDELAVAKVAINNANARRRCMGFWRDFIKAISNNPDSDGDVATGIMTAMLSLEEVDEYTEENFELVEAAFTDMLMLAEGMDYYASITASVSKDDAQKIKDKLIQEEDARVFVNIRPIDYDKGRSEVADQLVVGDL